MPGIRVFLPWPVMMHGSTHSSLKSVLKFHYRNNSNSLKVDCVGASEKLFKASIYTWPPYPPAFHSGASLNDTC